MANKTKCRRERKGKDERRKGKKRDGNKRNEQHQKAHKNI